MIALIGVAPLLFGLALGFYAGRKDAGIDERSLAAVRRERDLFVERWADAEKQLVVQTARGDYFEAAVRDNASSN